MSTCFPILTCCASITLTIIRSLFPLFKTYKESPFLSLMLFQKSTGQGSHAATQHMPSLRVQESSKDNTCRKLWYRIKGYLSCLRNLTCGKASTVVKMPSFYRTWYELQYIVVEKAWVWKSDKPGLKSCLCPLTYLWSCKRCFTCFIFHFS